MMAKVLFLCEPNELDKERQGYSRAFAKHGEVICWGRSRGNNLLHFLESLQEKPDLILHPDASLPFLPWGMTQVEIPTVCFQIDEFDSAESRIRWSMLFDYACVFHVGYDKVFQKGGHPQAVLLPHCADATLFQNSQRQRIYDVGWGGNSEGSLYGRRRRIILHLAEHFQMNEWRHRHSQEEMAEVYQSSKIVVHVNRDDHTTVTGMRHFEATAAGALLITGIPTDLTRLGFREGEREDTPRTHL